MAFEKYDFTPITQSIHQGLIENVSPLLTTIIEWTIIGVLYLLFIAVFGLFLVYAVKFVQLSSNALALCVLAPGE